MSGNTEAKTKRTLWYTRREGVQRGPYPEKQISRYILLGRIRQTDELRTEQGDWQSLSAYPELVPEVMKLPPTPENRQKLLMARMREDERQPGDRRDRTPAPANDVLERRSGQERRRAEADTTLRHRELKYQLTHDRQGNMNLYRYPLVFSLIVLIGYTLSYMLQKFEAEVVPPDCSAAPRPGVDWSNCNMSGLRANRSQLTGARLQNVRLDSAHLAGARLTGADLQYASINVSDLKRADLSHSTLVGVTLRGSDLR